MVFAIIMIVIQFSSLGLLKYGAWDKKKQVGQLYFLGVSLTKG